MIIQQTNIQLISQHYASHHTKEQESLRAWVGEPPASDNTATSTQVSISAAARQQWLASTQASTAAGDTNKTAATDTPTNAVRDDPRMKVLIQIIERLTGRPVTLLDSTKLTTANTTASPPDKNTAAPQSAGWGVEYERHIHVKETEQTTFVAQGDIQTADGKTIRFTLSLDMSRAFSQQSSTFFAAGDGVKKDPLVINFDANAAELTRTKFNFDIDADGQTEHLSFVGPNSGFLALDKNNNGRIDDGSELFGALSGNGFSDLAAYDQDNNGWIDANDAIFAKLQIWTRDANGNDTLSTLLDRNIGAIYLGNINTPFELKDATNTSHGSIRSSGIYLYKDGRAGSIQQVDLSV